MALIGEFEIAARQAESDEELDTFTLNGEVFTIDPEPNLIALGRFAKLARTGADTDDMESFAALVDTVASSVVEGDEARFLDLCQKKRAPADLLLKIVQAVLQAQAQRPTRQPSDSSAGLSNIGDISKAGSFSPAQSTLPGMDWTDTPFGRRELAANPEAYADVLPLDVAAAKVAQPA